jgi:phytoene dehydrogenase-like protein
VQLSQNVKVIRRHGMNDKTELPDTPIDVLVIGAGMAGLAAARVAAAAGADVRLLASHRPGGRAASTTTGGFIFNRGPRALYRGGAAEQVLTQLGVTVSGGAPGVIHGRWGDEVDPLPGSVVPLLRSRRLTARSKLQVAKLLGRIGAIDTAALAGTTFTQWLDDTGVAADTRGLLRMLGRVSTYVDQPDVASAELVVGMMSAAMRRGVMYLDGGWQSLVDQLAAGVHVITSDVCAVAGDNDGCEVTTTDGRTIRARSVVLAAGGPDTAARLLQRAPFDVGPPAHASCLDLGVRGQRAPIGLMGIDQPLYLSTHCPPAKLAPPGHQVVHVMRYREAEGDTAVSADDQRDELVAHARRAGIDPAHIVEQTYLHRMVACTAFATATRGGLRGRPVTTDSGIAGVFLAGDWVGPEGHLLDCVLASARDAARRACARIAS